MKKREKLSSQRVRDVWRRLLGISVDSFTRPNKKFTVFLEDDKFTCTCEDYTHRLGSYTIEWDEEQIHKEQQGCKHIAHHLNEIFPDGDVKMIDKWGSSREIE